jgi:hypothetical protein
MNPVKIGFLNWSDWKDIEPYLSKATVISTAEKIEDARVICLLQGHNPVGSDLAQKKFNQIIIQKFYSPGDVILVEDDATKPSDQLNKSQLDDLDVSKYTFKGWDDLSKDPKITQEIKDQQDKFDQAKKGMDSIQLNTCLKAMQLLKTRLLYASWDKRQQSMQNSIRKNLENSAGKVFVQMGPFHGLSDDPRHSNTAIKFLPDFNVPYVILKFQANFISSLAKSASGISLE